MPPAPFPLHPADPGAPIRVIVAGGDVGAVEAVFALQAGPVSVTLLTAEPELAERAMSVVEPFAGPHAVGVAMDEVARDGDAELVVDELQAVDAQRHEIRTVGGRTLPYEALLVACSPSLHPAVAGATTWTPDADAEVTGGLLRDIEEHYSRRVALVQPQGPTWPLAVYELALLIARAASAMGIDDAVITVVTPEPAPLAAFGTRASELVSGELRAAGVELRTGAQSAAVRHGTTLGFADGEDLRVDRVLAMPGVRGPGIEGVASDEAGFLIVDDHGRVPDAPDVWAIGDGTSRTIKHAGLTVQEADLATQEILARALGQALPETKAPVLRGMLLAGESRLLLQATDEALAADEPAVDTLWWPMTKIAGSRVGNYLAVAPSPDVSGARVVASSIPQRRWEGTPAAVRRGSTAGARRPSS